MDEDDICSLGTAQKLHANTTHYCYHRYHHHYCSASRCYLRYLSLCAFQKIEEQPQFSVSYNTRSVTPGLSLQKLLLASLHFPSGRIGQLLDKLSDTLMNGTDVKARLDKCIKHSNLQGMDEMVGQQTSLVNLLCVMEEKHSRGSTRKHITVFLIGKHPEGQMV